MITQNITFIWVYGYIYLKHSEVSGPGLDTPEILNFCLENI